MGKDFSTMEDSNRSSNPSIHDVLRASRRDALRIGAIAGLGALLQPLSGCASLGGGARLGFTAVPPDNADRLVVPPGYVAQVLAAWGDPVGIPGRMPPFRKDASNSAEDQAVQLGMHHDGVAFFPFDGSSTHGLIALNHEYTDDGLLHPDGFVPMTPAKVKKSQNAHGLSVYEVKFNGQQWEVVRPSRFARRFTLDTPFAVGGPAAGHPMMRTAADPAGRTVLGTLNNCASSKTPWGTYLSGEENWAFYFDGGQNISAHHQRWGVREKGFYGWAPSDPRFDVARTPNEPNRFGWIVEIDPYNPSSTPIKRTALGRAAHEGATTAVTADGRAVVYMGEDSRFEYIYKFVSRDTIDIATGLPVGNAFTNPDNLAIDANGNMYIVEDQPGGVQDTWFAFDRDNDGVAEAVPQYATTRIETWMRVAAADGFFELPIGASPSTSFARQVEHIPPLQAKGMSVRTLRA